MRGCLMSIKDGDIDGQISSLHYRQVLAGYDVSDRGLKSSRKDLEHFCDQPAQFKALKLNERMGYHLDDKLTFAK